jgi:hypothetical protein
MRAQTFSALFAVVLIFTAAPALAQTQLPPPTPDGVSEHLTIDQSGTTVNATQGASLAVELKTAGSGGFRWSFTSKPDFLSEPNLLAGPTIAQAPGGPRMLGAPTWQVFVFQVTGAGSGDVVLEQRGPGGAVAATFRATIDVDH